MTMHPSLTQKSKGRHRSVLKRFERIKRLKAEDKWEDDTSPLGLPKVKLLKIKIKKEKAPEAAAAAGAPAAEGAAAPAAPAAAKPAASKKEEKEKK